MNWLITASIRFAMFLINHNIFILEKQSRFCITTSAVFISSMYGVVSSYVIPLSVITTIYGVILNHARQSTRRIVAFASRSTTNANTSNTNTMNVKRELRLMQNMMVILTYFTCAGTPYFTLVLWSVSFKAQPPESLYLLSLNSITISVETMMVITFFISKDIKKNTFMNL